MEAIQRSQAGYQEEAKVMLAQGNRDKAQILLTKKKLVEKEASHCLFAPHKLTNYL